MGSIDSCVTYKGNIYFFCNENYQREFCSNPDKFYNNTKSIKDLQISILGGPHSGKTKQAKILASRYNLIYLSAEEILLALDEDSNQEELKNTRQSYGLVTKNDFIQ